MKRMNRREFEALMLELGYPAVDIPLLWVKYQQQIEELSKESND